MPQAGIDPLDEPDAGNQLPRQGQAGMSGEGGVVVAGVQLGARRGSIHLEGASCLWDYWLFIRLPLSQFRRHFLRISRKKVLLPKQRYARI